MWFHSSLGWTCERCYTLCSHGHRTCNKTFLHIQGAVDFCRFHHLEALLSTDLIISSFAVYLTRFVKPGTVRANLSAVRNLHIELGIPDPFLDTPLLQCVTREMSCTRNSSQEDMITNHNACPEGYTEQRSRRQDYQ